MVFGIFCQIMIWPIGGKTVKASLQPQDFLAAFVCPKKYGNANNLAPIISIKNRAFSRQV